MSRLNTWRTMLRFWLSQWERRLGFSFWPARVESIGSYVRISDRLATSGQPSAAQINAIARDGFQTIINLAPSHAANALPDERTIVEAAGLRYHHIPVDWGNPTDADFARFCDVMQDVAGQKVFVHCAANMRVSAFIYRYRRDILGQDPAVAAADLDRIWKPTGVWNEFIGGGYP